MVRNFWKIPAIAMTLFASVIAEAHPGGLGSSHGIIAGFLHPLTGLDHLLAMVGIGLWAAQLDRTAKWLVPGVFILALGLGGFLAVSGLFLPHAETVIMVSVILLGVLVARSSRWPLMASLPIVGAIAVFHGFACWSEMTADSGLVPFSFGFVLSSMMLSFVGVIAGEALKEATLKKSIKKSLVNP